MLYILTSFQVLCAPGSWPNTFLAVFNLFCLFQMFFSDFLPEIKKKGWKRPIKVFQPAFGCAKKLKAGQNTQHLFYLQPTTNQSIHAHIKGCHAHVTHHQNKTKRSFLIWLFRFAFLFLFHRPSSYRCFCLFSLVFCKTHTKNIFFSKYA